MSGESSQLYNVVERCVDRLVLIEMSSTQAGKAKSRYYSC